MSIFSKIGALIVILALTSYSIAIITEQRKRIINKLVLIFLTIGIILDITATTFMIIGSKSSMFTLHGLLGYSSLTLMLIDTVLIWRFYNTHVENTMVSKWLHTYSLIAYIWWVLAFITGGMLVFMK